MNNNLETLIRAIVPLSFMAIWALTSLFNRDSKSSPAAARSNPALGPRPRPAGGDPTLRFSNRPATAPAAISPASQRAPDRRDDEIVILSSSTMTPERNRPGRPGVAASRRPARGKPALPERPPEPPPTRTRLAGVSQNVNQQLTHSTMALTPLAPIAAMPTLALGSSSSPAPAAPVPNFRSAAAASLADPVKLREAFVLNEILRPPVALRGRAGRRQGG